MTDHVKVQEIIRLKDQEPVNIEPTKSALLIVDVQRTSPDRIIPSLKLLKS